MASEQLILAMEQLTEFVCEVGSWADAAALDQLRGELDRLSGIEQRVNELAALFPKRLDDMEWNTPSIGILENGIYRMRSAIED